MVKWIGQQLLLVLLAGSLFLHGQSKTSVLLQSTEEDERVEIGVDRSIYFPGDTVLLVIQRNDNSATAGIISPMLPIEGTLFRSIGRLRYIAVIPQTVTPGIYSIRLNVKDSEGRRFRYDTECIVTVEENQDVEHLHRFVNIGPIAGSSDVRSAVTLDRSQVRNLQVEFQRDSIRPLMGPQFLRITTTITLRDGIPVPSYERRVVTFRSRDDVIKDRAMFIQYRMAYGVFANIRPEELDQVLVPVDSLPDWAILGIRIEPDYTIKIGAVDRGNSLTQYYRVRGPTMELGFSLAVPKVLADTRADDPIEYGNTSAMIRLYFIDSKTGNRFPISAGIGMFGVNSPVDVGPGRGGFAWSMFLDLAELVRVFNIGFTKKVNIGIEIDPFIPIERKARILFVAQAGFSF
jgi:hypothetical protein